MPSNLPTEISIFFSRSCYSDSSLSPFSFSLLSSPFPFFFFILFGNTTKTAPVSALHQCHSDLRFHDSSLSPSPFPLLSPPFPFFFFTLFGNTTKTMPFFWLCRKKYIYGKTHLLTRSENVSNIKHVSQKHSICEGLRSCGKEAENIRVTVLCQGVPR